MPDSSDMMDIAVMDLSTAQVPFADDLLEGVGPMGCLWLLCTVAETCMRHWAAELSANTDGLPDDGGELQDALNAIGQSWAAAVNACISVGILPPESADAVGQTSL